MTSRRKFIIGSAALLTVLLEAQAVKATTFSQAGVTLVTTNAEMTALNPAVDRLVWLDAPKREGWFAYRAGSYATELANDPVGGLYIPATDGAWVRQGTWLFDGIHTEWFTQTTDTDDSPSFQAAIDIIATIFPNKGQISLQSKTYSLANGLTGIGGLAFVGANATAIWGEGATLLNTQTGTPEPMFSFTQNISAVRFENVRIDGADKVAPAVAVYEGGGTYGGYGFQFINVQFHHCIPAIYAEYSFDWVIDRCMFNECGNGTLTGTGRASMYFKNSGPVIANSNFIRVLNSFIDLSDGIGIYSDASGASGSDNVYFIVASNHFETHDASGYEAIRGVFESSKITENGFHGTAGNFIVLEDGSNENTIANNTFFNMGGYAVETHGYLDDIHHNHSWKPGTSDHYRTTGWKNRFIDNILVGPSSPSGVTNSGTATVIKI